MRLLIATDHYPPAIGGAQIQSRRLAHELGARGHDVVVATVWQPGSDAVEDDVGLAVHRLRQLRTLPPFAPRAGQVHQPPFPDPVTAVALRGLIARFRPDLVHSYGWISYSAAAALTGRSTPLLLTARDYAYSCAKRTLMHDGRECSGPALAKCVGCAGRHYGRAPGLVATLGTLTGRPLLRRKARMVHCVSSYVELIVRRDMLGGRAATIPTRVVHDAIPDGDAAEGDGTRAGSARLEELPSGPFVLFVGALRRVKGITELFEAYARLENPPPLVLIGTLEPDTPLPFPAGVHVLADLPHEAVLAAGARCLFAVMPSLWPEPFGMVVPEVMLGGRPVIGTAPGGHADIIEDGVSGLLVPRGDVDALAAAMQRLLDDEGLRERLGAAARERARAFAPSVVLPAIEALYGGLVADASARVRARA